MADPTQLHQIGMNLVTNAYHAVEKTTGYIDIKVKQIQLGPEYLIDEKQKPGKYAVLIVSDNGTGIASTNLQKIFDPYFTCLLYTSPSPRDLSTSRMPSSA
eukprot:TRINITY_DN33417_c0_g1_i2.p4 TRINITY_DN33417_c0_g1~~TRINITY_DN33417_c0_g1_i2.p4  ORF type:complete len:101 (-),score=15.93 TRINITY_DN33417_c0_g1_i2:121-423(-)